MDFLTALVFSPLIVALILMVLPSRMEKVFFFIGTITTAAVLGLSLKLYSDFPAHAEGFQFEEIFPWIDQFGVSYYLGVDGVSVVLIVLTAFLSLLSVFASYQIVKVRRKEFVVALLFLETCMIGTFCALDLFLFYIFWEAMLIPMYLLIGVWGGQRRIYATLKFFIYTMFGSVLMLVGVLALYYLHLSQFGFSSTAIPDLYRVNVPFDAQFWLFVLFFIAFAIKIPVFPFHTWLPDAHVEAPTAGSVILAGVLLKMGGFGLIRLAIPLFPNAAFYFAPFLGVLGVVAILYGAYVAWAQEDIKKLIAYSSVSHMGFVVLGLASLSSIGMNGAVFQMIAHGISTGALFLLIGIIYERRHTRMLVDFGGLASVMPRYSTAFLIIALASIGLPGLCGFVGEFLILTGSFQSQALNGSPWYVALSVLGVILAAGYMLYLFDRAFFGEVKFEENRKLKDLSWNETVTVLLPILVAIWLGIAPNGVLQKIEPAMERLVQRVEEKAMTAEVEKKDRQTKEALAEVWK